MSRCDYQNDLKKAGASNTTLNVGGETPIPEYSKLPAGYVYRRNQDGQIMHNEEGLPMTAPAPGTKDAREIEQANEKADKRQDRKAVKMGTTLDSLNLNIAEIENGGLPVTGLAGDARRTMLGRALTGSSAVDFGNRTNQITDAAALAEIGEMKEEGGGVGALTDGERMAIGNAVTALNNSVSAEEYVRAAKAYRKTALDIAFKGKEWTLNDDGTVTVLDPGQGDIPLVAAPQADAAANTPPVPEGAGISQSEWDALWPTLTEGERAAFQ